MKLYAAVSGRPPAIVARAYPHILVSYALDADLGILRDYTPESLLIDSGAFTVWTKGRSIDVDEYGQWCSALAGDDAVRERWGGIGGVSDLRFVNLDVIPGERGRRPTADEVTHAAEASMANADRLRDVHGLAVMEVYHYGEPPAVLDAILERRRPGEVAAVGGSVGVDHGERVRWHDAVWSHVFAHHAAVLDLAEPEGGVAKEVPPLHGLGASNEDLARRYPWWSCDSSTFTIPQRFGRTLNDRGRQQFITRPRPTHARDHRGTPPPAELDLRRNKDAQAIETIRILDRWARIARDMTAAWERRGIRCAS